MLVLLVNLDILLTIQKLYFKIYVLRSRLQEKFLGTAAPKPCSLLIPLPACTLHSTGNYGTATNVISDMPLNLISGNIIRRQTS